jgi:hypothetical protein
MKTVLAMMIFFGATSAFANVAIECGNQVNKEDGTVGQRIFMLSSEDGQALKVYNSADQEMRNAKLQQGPNNTLILTVVQDQGLGGPVGLKFIIPDYRGQNIITAEQYAVGGFAGGSKVGKLDCVVSEM